ncbi:hypothetical protein RUM44_007048 [Polyplax serrata]|uniref:Uncharacterized protein n=1 Tax=Polyplax serrata TaxID=468196 RepID=A0ABR1AZM5_POLSC
MFNYCRRAFISTLNFWKLRKSEGEESSPEGMTVPEVLDSLDDCGVHFLVSGECLDDPCCECEDDDVVECYPAPPPPPPLPCTRFIPPSAGICFRGCVPRLPLRDPCGCLNSIIRPQVCHEFIDLPVVDRFLQTLTHPVYETTHYGIDFDPCQLSEKEMEPDTEPVIPPEPVPGNLKRCTVLTRGPFKGFKIFTYEAFPSAQRHRKVSCRYCRKFC